MKVEVNHTCLWVILRLLELPMSLVLLCKLDCGQDFESCMTNFDLFCFFSDVSRQTTPVPASASKPTVRKTSAPAQTTTSSSTTQRKTSVTNKGINDAFSTDFVGRSNWRHNPALRHSAQLTPT